MPPIKFSNLLFNKAAELGVSHHQVRKLIKAGILKSEQIMPDAPHQIRAADLASEQVVTALERKGRPCRAVSKSRSKCFQILEERVPNESVIACGHHRGSE
jgi:hypothetical protein